MSEPAPSPILTVNGLTKRYGNFTALKPTSFTLRAGEIAVLTGPNGSGKTTLLNCVGGFIKPTEGEIAVMGYDLDQDEVNVRRRMACVPDVPRFYLELTAWEHLRFIAAASSALEGFEGRAEDLLRRYGLWEARDQFPHMYSRGMRLKLGLLLGFIRPANLLLLDEPTSAIDQEGFQLLLEDLRQKAEAGAAILLSSHDPALPQALSARILRMRAGEMIETANE